MNKRLFTTTTKFTLAGIVFGMSFPVIASIMRIVDAGLSVSIANIITIQSSDRLLWIIDTAPFFLGLFTGIAGYRQEMLEKSNNRLLMVEKELRSIKSSLEEKMEERLFEITNTNQMLKKRTDQLKIIAEIAQSVVLSNSMSELLSNLTRLISGRFGFYHVGIFLLDSNKEFAVLQFANSEGGAKMLEHGHRLRVGQQGIVGLVTLQGTPRIALDVGKEADFFNNPYLPETHSEVALPLKLGQEIIGALDIQSKEINAFTQEDVEVFTILANQVTVAIQNIRSLEQAQRSVQESNFATSQLTGMAWRGYLENIKTKGFRYDGVKVEPINERMRHNQQGNTLTIPVQLRGQTIGRLKLKSSDASRNLTDDDLAVIESTASRVALAIDAARLLEDAQKRASRESFLAEIGSKLSTSFQLDSILRDTVEELGQTLNGSTVTFQLVNPLALQKANDDNKDSGNNNRSSA